MTRARIGSWLLGVALLVFLASQSMSAIGPAYVALHGGTLRKPLVLRPAIGSLMFMWAGGNFYEHQQAKVPSGRLEGRQHLDYDVFWGQFTADELSKPEMASQHGRLYFPTKDQAAVVVLTAPAMGNLPGETHARPTPVPSEIDGFASGRALAPDETAALVAAGVPLQ